MDQNLSDALEMVFGMLVFIIALSSTMFIFNKLKENGEGVYKSRLSIIQNDLVDKDRLYIGVLVDQVNPETGEYKMSEGIEKYSRKRVTKSDVISMLYRYYKESFSIKVVDKSGNIKQIFDSSLEQRVANLTKGGEKYLADIEANNYDKQVIMKTFANSSNQLFMFGAPWRVASSEPKHGIQEKDNFNKDRVELYISGKRGFINGVKVDYSSEGRNWFANLPADKKFKQYVINYNYSGDVSINDGEQFGTDIVRGASPLEKVEVVFVEE